MDTRLFSLVFLWSQVGPLTDWILVCARSFLCLSLGLCLVLAGLIISMGDWKTVALFIGLIIFGEWQQMLQHGWTLLFRAGVLDSRGKACLCCKIFNQHPRPAASGERMHSDMAWGHREVCVLLESALRSYKHLHLTAKWAVRWECTDVWLSCSLIYGVFSNYVSLRNLLIPTAEQTTSVLLNMNVDFMVCHFFFNREHWLFIEKK